MRLLLLAIVLSLAGSAHAEPLRVLFIGNSLTYTNDLPAMFERIAAVDGRRVTAEMIALPNYSLGDHLSSGIRATLARKKFDVIVLQQGPSSLDESRQLLIRDAKVFASVVPRSTKIAVLMVWPPRARWRALPDVAESHRLAAEAVSGVLIPAGTAMQAALERDPQLELFTDDGFHPAMAGTYLAALTVYRTLVGPLPESVATQRDARRIAGRNMKATDAQLRVLWDVAMAQPQSSPGS